MFRLLFLTLTSCFQDVSIMKVQDKESLDSSTVITDTNISTDTNNVISDTSDTNTSQILNGNVGYTNFYLRQVACPACVGAQQEITVEFVTKFFENTTANHTDWIPEVGTCTNQLLITVPSTNPVNMGSQLIVEGSVNNFAANYINNEYYASIYESMYDRNTNYTVQLSDNESFNFKSIEGFDSLEPYEMLYVDPSYAFAAPIYKNGMTFSWAPYGSDSSFLITIAIYTPDGSQLLGYVACAAPDQGFMTIPGEYLQQYPHWGLAAIHLARHKVVRVPYYPLEGYIETHMEWEVVGTGHIE